MDTKEEEEGEVRLMVDLVTPQEHSSRMGKKKRCWPERNNGTTTRRDRQTGGCRSRFARLG